MSAVQTAPEVKSPIALGLVAASVALGLIGDGLLRATPWGLNAGLWTAALTIGLLIIARWQRLQLRGGGRWLLLPAFLFAAAIAWRDSPTLVGLNILAVAVALGLAAVRSRAGRVRVAEVTDYLFGLSVAALGTWLGPVLLVFSDIDRSRVSRTRWSPQMAAVGRGLTIGLPLVLLFGCLFAAADAVFEGLVTNLFAWDVRAVVSHGFLFGFWGWLAGGYLRQALLSSDVRNPIRRCPHVLSLGIVETGIVLGLLDLLFLAFVLVQLGYLFGGTALVESSAGWTYAEYARRGFFELVAVAALVLPLLLLGEWVLRKESRATLRGFRLLAGVLIALLFIIMASALVRMRLYQQEFGLTELRLYTTAFMAWLAVVFVWLLLTVLRGRRSRFAFGALVAGFVFLTVLNAINPDAYIARTNIERAAEGKRFDSAYAASLSDDAVPTLINGLPSLAAADRTILIEQLRQTSGRRSRGDWRTWNRGRALAADVLNENGTVQQPTR